MKTICFLLIATTLLFSCVKPIEADHQLVGLNIIQTTTPKNVLLNQNITSTVRVSGSDLCYNFAYFTLNRQQFFLDIHAVGTYPAKSTACPQAIYNKDTTISIPVSIAGDYILRFYNGTQLFKSDTVQVQ